MKYDICVESYGCFLVEKTENWNCITWQLEQKPKQCMTYQ